MVQHAMHEHIRKLSCVRDVIGDERESYKRDDEPGQGYRRYLRENGPGIWRDVNGDSGEWETVRSEARERIEEEGSPLFGNR